MTNRFVDATDLPTSLWNESTKCLKLPSMLIAQWKVLLHQNDLLEQAKTKAPKGYEGGQSQEDCDNHLAWRYNGSCGRVVLSLLDPNQKLNEIVDAYVSNFSGGKVFLADLPCGSGAASISILTTIAELRAENVLPRIPLTVVIIGADISQPACDYFDQQVANLSNSLMDQAITVEHQTFSWDVLDKFSTADLIREVTLASQDCISRLLVISNFSGFLKSEKNFEAAIPQFDDLFIHCRGISSTAIWIEPQSTKADGLFSFIASWFVGLFRKLLSSQEQEDIKSYAKADVNFEQPIKDGTFKVRLSVRRFELPL